MEQIAAYTQQELEDKGWTFDVTSDVPVSLTLYNRYEGVSIQAQTWQYPYNGTVTVPSVSAMGFQVPSPGLRFDCWYTGETPETGTTYRPDDTFAITADMSMYTSWVDE